MISPKWQSTCGNVSLYLGDFLDVMHEVKSNHIITDPPFEKEAHTLQRRVTRGKEAVNEPLSFPALKEEERIGIAVNASKMNSGWVLVFCQAEAVSIWRDTFESNGVSYKRPMVWIKPDGMPQFTGDRPGMGYESIVAAWSGEGKSTWNGGGKHGVFTHIKNSGGSHLHPTQKPLPLILELVSLFTNKGDTICDPFMGSGTTGVACITYGCKFIGIEKDPTFFEIAKKRIQQELDRGDIFNPAPRPTTKPQREKLQGDIFATSEEFGF